MNENLTYLFSYVELEKSLLHHDYDCLAQEKVAFTVHPHNLDI